MRTEKSAGAVVFYRAEKIEYLLLLANFWGFPKGHIERGESEHAAALREIREEAGLEVTLLDGFRAVDEYSYARHGERVGKIAVFFLAEAPHRETKISWEHSDLAWLSFDEAMERLTYRNGQEILRKANEFLEKENKNTSRPGDK
jgi:8-oxo-dGTP pyrophosphatase MutT (NUDIX family)